MIAISNPGRPFSTLLQRGTIATTRMEEDQAQPSLALTSMVAEVLDAISARETATTTPIARDPLFAPSEMPNRQSPVAVALEFQVSNLLSAGLQPCILEWSPVLVISSSPIMRSHPAFCFSHAFITPTAWDYCVPSSSPSPPTRSPTSNPTKRPTTTGVGNNLYSTSVGGCGSRGCEECEGDCDSDADCQGSLTCFNRNALEFVPGCGSGGMESE